MGIDISEHYTFIGKTEQVKSFYGFLKQYDAKHISSNEYHKKVFDLAEQFAKAVETQYPIDKTKIKDTYLGYYMRLTELKELEGYTCFCAKLENRSSISAYIFKQMLEKYFIGVFMYYYYTGDSMMFNTCCTNDKLMRFYAHAEEGKYLLRDGWNEISVLYDGNYTKEEIADSYRLFLGNTDINPDFLPVFCGGQPLKDDQYPIEDTQAEHDGISEPPVEICRKFGTNQDGKNKIDEMTKFHGLTPQWQNVPQRTIDYNKYPALKGCPHIIGTRDDGTPYLYRAVAYDLEVRIPECITDFDKNAFDWELLYESAYRFNQGSHDHTLILNDVQKSLVNIKEIKSFFHCIKTESGEILYEHKKYAEK